ncbi:MAG: hypothetical protein ACFB12_17985 [Leptolyngbyaceae cyanobacterium]
MPTSNLRQAAIALLDQLPQHQLEAVVRLLSVFTASIPSSEGAENLLQQDRVYEPTSDNSIEIDPAVPSAGIEPGLISNQEQTASLQPPSPTVNSFPPAGQSETYPADHTKTASVNFRLDNLEYDSDEMPIWELTAQLSAMVPDEEWKKVPTDLARNFDYYQQPRNDT